MKRFMLVIVTSLLVVDIVSATEVTTDTFGDGANQFTIDFVTISGDASSANGTQIGESIAFNDPGDYRMGKFEISNDQWNKFQASYGTVTGSMLSAYDESPYYTGTNVPTNAVSWHEAAQFVNYLNTSTGHQAAYKFTGTKGTNDYSFSLWKLGDEGYDSANPWRNNNAKYFLPTEDEWVKACHWDGSTLKSFPTSSGFAPVKGVDSNYDYAVGQPWDCGSGTEELNGTYDMMGNLAEWTESKYYYDKRYSWDSVRSVRGGWFNNSAWKFGVDKRDMGWMGAEYDTVGFRVASVVPEPCSIILLGLGSLMLRRRKA